MIDTNNASMRNTNYVAAKITYAHYENGGWVSFGCYF